MLWNVGEDLDDGLPVDVYVDFDGTIAPGEPTDRLFDRFADASWRAIDQAWLDRPADVLGSHGTERVAAAGHAGGARRLSP